MMLMLLLLLFKLFPESERFDPDFEGEIFESETIRDFDSSLTETAAEETPIPTLEEEAAAEES